MNRIDTRKQPCPAPVIMTKKALESASEEPLQVLADSGAPRENIIKFANSRGFDIKEAAEDGSCLLTISRHNSPVLAASSQGNSCSPAILISSDKLGDGPEELGRLLMKNFIITLLETPNPPDRIFLVNRGVLLAVEGAELVEPLSNLANFGVEIFSCGVCLDYFSVREKLATGTVTTMYTIVEALTSSGSVTRI